MDDINSYLNSLNTTLTERQGDLDKLTSEKREDNSLGEGLLALGAPFIEQSVTHPVLKKGVQYATGKISDLIKGDSLSDVASSIKSDALGELDKATSGIRQQIESRVGSLGSQAEGRLGDLRTSLEGRLGDARSQFEGRIGDARSSFENQLGDSRGLFESQLQGARMSEPMEIEMQDASNFGMSRQPPGNIGRYQPTPGSSGSENPTLADETDPEDLMGSSSGVSQQIPERLEAPEVNDASTENSLASKISSEASDALDGTTEALGEATLDSLADDVDPFNFIVTAGLGLATLFSSFGELFKPHHDDTIIGNPSSQFGTGS